MEKIDCVLEWENSRLSGCQFTSNSFQVNSNKIPANFFVETDSYIKRHVKSQNNFKNEEDHDCVISRLYNIK